MDAFPGYTYFEPTRKVLCAIQMVDESISGDSGEVRPVFPHTEGESIEEAQEDSVTPAKVMNQEEKVGLGSVKVKELVAPGAVISDNGDVTADLLEKENFTEFSHNPDEQKGYYFPTQINVPEATKMLLSKKNGSGDYNPVREKQTYDPTIVVRVAGESGTEEQEVTDLKIETFNGEKGDNPLTVTELHFNGVTFVPKAGD